MLRHLASRDDACRKARPIGTTCKSILQCHAGRLQLQGSAFIQNEMGSYTLTSCACCFSLFVQCNARAMRIIFPSATLRHSHRQGRIQGRTLWYQLLNYLFECQPHCFPE